MTDTTTDIPTHTTIATAPPADTGAARFAGWTGIAFTAALVAGFVLVAQVPAYDEPDSAWVAWLEDDNVPTVIGTLLLVAAGLLLMAFITCLASHMSIGGRDDHRLALLRGAGTIAGGTLATAAVLGGAMAAAVTFVPEFEPPGADIIRALDQASLGLLLVGTGWSMAAAIAVCSWVGRRTARLPNWLTAAGWVVAVLLMFSPMFVPIVCLPLWVLVTGIVVLRAET